MNDLTDALNQLNVVLNHSQNAPEEETVALRAMISALGAYQRQVSDLKAENLTVKKLNQKLMQKALLALCKRNDKKLDRLSETIPTDMLGISSKVVPRLAFWLAEDVSELCPDRDTFTRYWHSWSEHSRQHAMPTQRHGSVVPLRSLIFFSGAEHYNFFLSSHNSFLASVMDVVVHTSWWFSMLSSQTAKRRSASLFRVVPSFSESFGRTSPT